MQFDPFRAWEPPSAFQTLMCCLLLPMAASRAPTWRIGAVPRKRLLPGFGGGWRRGATVRASWRPSRPAACGSRPVWSWLWTRSPRDRTPAACGSLPEYLLRGLAGQPEWYWPGTRSPLGRTPAAGTSLPEFSASRAGRCRSRPEFPGSPPWTERGQGEVKPGHLLCRHQRVRESPPMAAGADAHRHDGRVKVGRNTITYIAAVSARAKRGESFGQRSPWW